MMVNREYMLSDPDERMRQYKEFLAEALVKYHKRTFEQTMELFERQQDLYEKSFIQAFQKAEKFLRDALDSQRKGKLKYVHFSYLLSGALSGEHLVKMDFYDGRYYRDVEETDCFWDCWELFPFYEEECRQMEADMKEKIVRVHSGELSRIRIGLTAMDYLVLKSVMEILVHSESFLSRILPYCGRTTALLYGAYLDEAELVYQLEGSML